MTPRSLFLIILKVLGILLLEQVFVAFTDFISRVVGFFISYGPSDGLLLAFFSLIGFVILLWIAYWLIFKPNELISKFALDQHFSESKLELNISIGSIIHIALIVTASLILLAEIPFFIRTVYTTLNQNELYTTAAPDWSPLIYSGVRILIALLLIGERKRIVPLLLKKDPIPPSPHSLLENEKDENKGTD